MSIFEHRFIKRSVFSGTKRASFSGTIDRIFIEKCTVVYLSLTNENPEHPSGGGSESD
jgi:hypothetical protein